ncbi:FecR family protein [Ohtaekwangia kribbensis]|jgi:transmembrane sensor|uniref:FecR family protein n=1 Tax=Ohtaekwangia kribbensis TaxID=688913 RepID=A0ABW3K8J4_9BACT
MAFDPQTETDFLKHEYFVQWVLSPTKESSAYWQHWLKQNPDKVEMLGAARDLLLSFEMKETHSMDDTTYYKILDNLLQENAKQKDNDTSGRSNGWLLAAASVIIFSSIALVGYFTLTKGKDTAPIAQAIEYNYESVPGGVKKTIMLPDSSIVTLNSVSELKYPTRFSDTVREVYLTGQAFFEVTKNARAPFIVHTKKFSTCVLGTSFDIRSYEGEKSNHVAVVTGKVRVMTQEGNSQLLLPHDMTSYNENQKTLKKSTFDPAFLLAWRKGIIVFDHATFEEVTTYLSRWYGVDFNIEKDFKVKGLYTGEFNKEPLITVLNGISYSSHFSFRVDGKTVYISKPKPNL